MDQDDLETPEKAPSYILKQILDFYLFSTNKNVRLQVVDQGLFKLINRDKLNNNKDIYLALIFISYVVNRQ